MFEEKITPATIAATTFRIPLYQRPYAWEEQQVTQLLTDLYEAFQEGLKSGAATDYHIGILSIAQTQSDKSRYDLIDGQQRITTLFLIGKVAETPDNKWSEFLSSDRLDLYGREADKRFLHGDDDTECNRRMVDAVRCAKEFFDKRVTDRVAFSQFIYDHAAFFLSEVPPTYSVLDKNQQFVRMNNRGKQLEKHEILKVQLLAKITDERKRKDAFLIWNGMVTGLTGIDDIHQDATKSLREILASKEPGSEPAGKEVLYTSILTIPEFLLIALARFLPPEKQRPGAFNADKLLEIFSDLKEGKSIVEFTEVLKKQVEKFRLFFIILSKQEKYEFGGESDTENKDLDFGPNCNGKQRLITVQSFLHVSTEPHHWMIPAFNWCESQARPVKSEEFIKKLEAIDDSLTRDKRRNVSSVSDANNMAYGSISHYWFYRLDYELWKRFQPGTHPDPIWSNLPKEKQISDLVENFRFRRCGSVEHIVPQTPMNGWNNQPANHLFGNLALISSSRNSKFSNLPPDGKKDIILQSPQPYTESLKMLHFLWCYPKPEPKNHGEAMFGILREVADRESPPL